VVDSFSTGLIDVCDGQALDMDFMQRADVTTDEYFAMIERKTARLLEMSVAIGANVGGATNGRVEALRMFAREIGVAFQVQDDILDLFGSESFGKQPGGDIVEGKRTWLVIECARRVRRNSSATEEHREMIYSFFAKNGLPRESVPAVIAMMEHYGVIADAKAIVEERTALAHAHLHSLPETEARELMGLMAELLMNRKS
jgi:geranylgeranyl diphosphate synthase type II